MSDWRPIETCPIETVVLVWCPIPADVYSNDSRNSVWIVRLDSDGPDAPSGGFFIEHDGDGGYMSWRNLRPTHWMPLPGGPIVNGVTAGEGAGGAGHENAFAAGSSRPSDTAHDHAEEIEALTRRPITWGAPSK